MALIAKSQEAEAVLRIVLKRSLNLKAVLEVVAGKEVLRSILAVESALVARNQRARVEVAQTVVAKRKVALALVEVSKV